MLSAAAIILLALYARHLNKQIHALRCELFKYSTQEYVMNRFSNVWSEIHHTQDAVAKLQSKRGNK